MVVLCGSELTQWAEFGQGHTQSMSALSSTVLAEISGELEVSGAS